MRIVMTIVGVDKVGIIAKASSLLAEKQCKHFEYQPEY